MREELGHLEGREGSLVMGGGEERAGIRLGREDWAGLMWGREGWDRLMSNGSLSMLSHWRGWSPETGGSTEQQKQTEEIYLVTD